jgi:hypothetical protein
LDEEEVKHAQGQAQQGSVETTADPEAFDRYLRVYAEVYGTLWDEKLKRRWARNGFGTYIQSRPLSTLARQLKTDGAGDAGGPTLKEGAGAPSQKGRNAR